MSTTYTTASPTCTTTMTNEELASALHVDLDSPEFNNALLYKASAEEYLKGAGIKKDYSLALYKHLVIILTARSLENPEAFKSGSEIISSGLVALISQLRQTQSMKGG